MKKRMKKITRSKTKNSVQLVCMFGHLQRSTLDSHIAIIVLCEKYLKSICILFLPILFINIQKFGKIIM